MRKGSHARIIAFVLEQAAQQPVSRRIELYEDLAVTCGNEPEAKQLYKLAQDMKINELSSREFMFSFTHKNLA